jgi:hypothetical protein
MRHSGTDTLAPDEEALSAIVSLLRDLAIKGEISAKSNKRDENKDKDKDKDKKEKDKDKKKTCRFIKRGQTCKAGKSCKFSHGAHATEESPTPPAPPTPAEPAAHPTAATPSRPRVDIRPLDCGPWQSGVGCPGQASGKCVRKHDADKKNVNAKTA